MKRTTAPGLKKPTSTLLLPTFTCFWIPQQHSSTVNMDPRRYQRQEHHLPLPALPRTFDWTLPTPSPTSSSGYGTEPCSPLTPTGGAPLPSSSSAFSLWSQNTEDQSSHCCSLVNPIWRNSSSWATQLDSNRTVNRGSQELATTQRYPAVLPSRDYSTSNVSRAIVTMDVEQIGPQDQRHHPFDRSTNQYFQRKPWGIATNSRTEQVYIADRQHHGILVFGPDGEFQQTIGGFGSQPGQFNRPCGLTYDATYDRLLVVDKDNHRIQVFNATSGLFLFAFGSRGRLPGKFSFPWGITVSKDGSHIAITDTRNRRIQLFSSDGTYLRHFDITIKESTQMLTRLICSYPRGIVFDNTGDFLYITDFNLHRIYRLDINFHQLDTIAGYGLLRRPSGIDVDHDGNILVCDSRNNLIRILRPDGRPAGQLDFVGRSRFDLPLDISIMPAGFIAVLDLNGRVRVF